MADLLDGIADRSAETDEIAEDNAPEWNATWQSLMRSPEGRDAAIWHDAWEEMIEPLSLMAYEGWVLLDTVDYVAAEDSVGKPILWSAMIAAARAQADVILFRALLPTLDKHAAAQNREAGRLDRGRLVETARIGPGKQRFKDAKEKRKKVRNGTNKGSVRG